MCELIGTQYTALLSKNNNGVLVFIKAGGIIIKFVDKNFSVFFLVVFFRQNKRNGSKKSLRVISKGLLLGIVNNNEFERFLSISKGILTQTQRQHTLYNMLHFSIKASHAGILPTPRTIVVTATNSINIL